VQFAILGPLEVAADDEPVEIRGAKLRSLLAILLVRANEVVSTDRLIEDLWGDEPPADATSTLHIYVSRLRSSLGSAESHRLVTRRPGYMLRVAGAELDATRFETLLGEGRGALAAGDPTAASTALGAALDLWRGEPLAEFEELGFARGEIARLRELRDQGAEDRMEAALAVGRGAELVPELERLVGEQPLRERRWGQLMLALYRANRQAEALRTFQDLRRLLGDELGIEPSRDLVRLEEAILLQRSELLTVEPTTPDPSLPPPATPTPPTDVAPALAPPMRDLFMGRARELERLGGIFDRLDDTTRPFALLSGPPGIGKTSLAAEFARAAMDRGAVALWGRCDEDVLIPYQPFIEALRDWANSVTSDHVRSTLGRDAAEIARYVPAIARLVPSEAEAAPGDPETERYRWFEAVGSALTAIAGGRPCVLVVDDLQWADKPTQLLLRHLVRRSDPGRLFVVATFRDQGAADDDTAELLADLRHEVAFDRIDLVGLDEDAVEAMVEAEAARPLGPAGHSLARTLQTKTGGNAFFVTEVIRHLRETGALAHIGADSPTAGTTDLGIPAGVWDVVMSRVTRLSTQSRDLLVTAAVLGSEFEPAVLRRVVDASPDAVVDALDESERARLLVPLGGAQRYTFSHMIVRDALYSGVSTARRQDLHKKIASVFESLHREQPDVYLAGLAYHACEAAPLVEPSTAIDYARRAGDQASSQVAYEVAAEHYERAIGVIDRLGVSDDPLRCQLLLSLGQAHNRAGAVAEGKGAFLHAAALARAQHRPDLLARAALGYGGTLAASPDTDDRHTIELLDEALEALGPEDSAAGALALGRRAHWLHHTVEPEGQRRSCEEAIAIARRLDDPATLAAVLQSRYWALYGPDDADERLEVAIEITDLGEALDEPELVLLGMQCRLHALIELGQADALRDVAARRNELARALRQPHHLWAVTAYEAMIAATEGRLDEAEELVNTAFAMRRRTDLVSAMTVYGAQIQQVRWLQQRMDEIVDVHEMLATRDPGRPTWLGALAWAKAESGDLEGAAVHLDRLAEFGFDQLPRNFEWLPTVAAIAITCRRLRDVERSAQLYPLLLPYADHNTAAGQSAFYGAVSHHLGTLAATMGREDDASRHFDAAMRRHEAFGATPFVELTERERSS